MQGTSVIRQVRLVTRQPQCSVVRPSNDLSFRYNVVSMRDAADTLSTAASTLQHVDGAEDVRLVDCAFDPSSSTVLFASFSAPITSYALKTSSFTLRSTGGKVIPLKSMVAVSETMVALTAAQELRLGDTLLTSVNSEYSTEYFPSLSGTVMTIIEESSDTCCGVSISRLLETTPTAVTIEFSEAVTSAAEDIVNYTAPRQTHISSVRFVDSSHRIVRIVFDEEYPLAARGFEYVLKAHNGIRGMSGRIMRSDAGNTVSWVYGADASSAVFAFPQPCKLSRCDALRFSGVPRLARVVIMDLDGMELASVTARDDNGGVEWNMMNELGSRINSGVYLFAVVYADGSSSEKHSFVITP